MMSCLFLVTCIKCIHMRRLQEVGVFRWHMKGKRNRHNLANRPINARDGKITSCNADTYNGSTKGILYRSMGNSFKMGRTEPSGRRTSGQGFYHKKEFNHGSYDGDLADKIFGPIQLTGYGNKKYHFPLQAAKDCGRSHSSFNYSDRDSQLISRSGWEAGRASHVARSVYWVKSLKCFEPVYACEIEDWTGSMLVELDLKVQAIYQGEHVPLVSLMSRLSDKAITGHFSQIEILEDGSSGQVILETTFV